MFELLFFYTFFVCAFDTYIYNICYVLMYIKDQTPPYIPSPEIWSLSLSQCVCMCHSAFSDAHG